jgi:hypothetical protein
MGLMFTLLLLAVLQSAPARPDLVLTPGKARPLTQAAICGTKWGTDRRFVSESMKRHVFRAYGIPWSDRALYEVDHLVPRSIAGADDILNLWPQPWAAPGARQKDRLEVVLGDMYCRGEISLRAAQRAFLDWPTAYARYVH